jgi:hypothetical protein
MLGPGKPLGGGTVFKIEYAGAGSGGAPSPTPSPNNSAPGPIELIDPNVGPDPDTPDDPTPDLRGLLLGTSPWTQSSYQVFVDYPRLAKGFAADGLTPLILRCSIPAVDGAAGTLVTFTVNDEIGRATTPDQVGTLGCIYSKSCANSGGTSYTVQPQLLANNQYEAFVRLIAPLDFVRNSDDVEEAERVITVTATLPQAPGGPPRKRVSLRKLCGAHSSERGVERATQIVRPNSPSINCSWPRGSPLATHLTRPFRIM